MNPLPFVAAAAAIAVIPPLRRRVVPVVGATAGATARVATTMAVSVVDIAGSAVDGISGVASAALHGPADAESNSTS